MGSWIQNVKMRPVLILSFLLILLQLSNAIFFGSPTSTCRSNNQCPNIRRRGQVCNGSYNLLGIKIPKCQDRYYTIGGRCLNRSSFLCNLGGGRNCNYRECAECLKSEDCPPC